VRDLLQSVAMAAVDTVYACTPRSLPSREALLNCRIVSHRGEHDNDSVFENTLPAFRAARQAGVWGLETDIRWTRDLVPVINHDADGQRLFAENAVIAGLSFAELRARLPQLPSLEELVDEFGGRLHLMLELKAEHYPDPARQQAILREILSPLEPVVDYHFLALDAQLFAQVDCFDKACCLPVAELNTAAMSRVALASDLGGLTGHFVLLSAAVQGRHEIAGQRVGTGFVRSRNSLYRELNRGVEWIFSNDAVKLQRMIDRLLESGGTHTT
jgi:glycerophosphoryl diester phosphodiesterase